MSPETGEERPNGHAAHVILGWRYLPGSQPEHCDTPVLFPYEPMLHPIQTVAPKPEKVITGHGVHAAWFALALKVPAGQELHDIKPVVLPYFPLGQLRQASNPGTGEYMPMLQAVHVVPDGTPDRPAGQSRQEALPCREVKPLGH